VLRYWARLLQVALPLADQVGTQRLTAQIARAALAAVK